MSIADKPLTIDVWGGITSLSLIQGESNGRKLYYEITDKGEPLDLTGKSVRLYVVKPDGKELITNAVYNVLTRTRDGGKIQIRCKDATAANGLKGQTLLRAASIRWVTNEPWPESL